MTEKVTPVAANCPQLVLEGHRHNNVAGVDRAHSEIIRGMVVVGIFVLVGKLASAAKEMIVAWRYGVGAEVDAYLFLFNIVNWPVSLWIGVLTAVLIPIIAKNRGIDQNAEALFRAELFGRSLLAGLVLSFASAVVIYALLNMSLTGLSVNSVIAAKELILPTSLLASLGTIVGLFSVWLLADGRHVNTLLESVPALVICLSIVLFGHEGITALAWGALAGCACHAVCLAIPLRRDLHTPRLSGNALEWSAFWTGFTAMLAGQVALSVAGLIDQFFVARLPEGSLSTLSYAQKILALILGLCTTAVGRSMIPIFARAATEDKARIRRITTQWVWVVFLLSAVGLILVWLIAPWIVKSLFERGAFTSVDTEAVVAVLRFGLLQVPFNVAAVILFYALAGQRLFGALTIASFIALIAKVIANSILVTTWGIYGIMLGTAIMNAVLMFIYIFIFSRNSEQNKQ